MKVSTALSATLIAAGVVMAAGSASADEVDRRQARQYDRIERGVRDGSLTPHEAARLQARQDRIRYLERSAERDGRLSRDERLALDRAQDHAGRSIRHERHDRDMRYDGYKPRWGGWWGHPRHRYGYHGHPRPWYRWW
jgi:hypothetical protein